MKKFFPIPLFLLFSMCIFILWMLGTWQLNKNHVHKKNNITFTMNAQGAANKLYNLKDVIENLTYVEIEGIELTEKSIYLEPRTFRGIKGYHKISTFKVDNQYLLVNQGFLKKKLVKNKKKIKRRLEGFIIKIPEPKFFELENDIKNNIWYTLNLNDFKNEFKLNLSPYILYEQNIEHKKDRKAVLPNLVSSVNHLNYALTWYFLSLSLCVIFLIYFKKTYIKYE